MSDDMVELKLPAQLNRGFNVRMKLLHKHGRRLQEKNILCFRYYKWVLWFSLSLYFFSSYFISYKPIPIPQSNSYFSKSAVVSRALFESTNSTFLLQHPKSDQEEEENIGLLKDLKIYVYELPSKYNTDWLINERCSSHLFASEVAIHRALLNSDDWLRTFDPFEADFFFVPVYLSCNFSTANGFPAIGHARSLLSSAVHLVSSTYPFWNRSLGADHVFVASHDYGACFHTMEERAIEHGTPGFLKNSIILQTFGVKYDHPCQHVENVVIPPYVSPESVQKTLQKSPLTSRRDIWVFFRGKMEVHPKNNSGRFYSRKVRTEIWRKFSGDRRFYLRRHRFPGYRLEIVRSVFCLCPLGWAPWSPRLVESVVLGCVPVIIADGIRLPFPDAIRWPDISLSVAEKDVGKLGAVLEQVAATNLSAIQRNLWDPAVRRALQFNDPIQEGDATCQVIRALKHRLDRWRGKVSGQ